MCIRDRASSQPVDLVLLSSSAPPTHLGIFLAAFAELPRARPIPIVLAGAARPAWAQPDCAQCARPYDDAELLAAVRAVMDLGEEKEDVGLGPVTETAGVLHAPTPVAARASSSLVP